MIVGHGQPRAGFLFRVEDNHTGRPARVLVQSRRAPQSNICLTIMATREINPMPTQGQRLAFLLTANPIRNIKDRQLDSKPGKRRDSCRVPLIHEDEQRDWLTRKLDPAAGIEALSIIPHQPIFFRKGNRAGKLVTISFEGILRVNNADSLLERMENGIGPAKGFGCGLMLVRRV